MFESLFGGIARVGREIGKGIGAVGGFLGDVVSGATESFSDPGFQLPTGGLGRKVGGLIGEVGEVAVGAMIPPFEFPTPQYPLPPTVPGQLPGIPTPLPRPMGEYGLPIPSVPPGGGTMPTTIPVPGMGVPFPGMEEVEPMAQPVALPGGALIPYLGGAAGAGALAGELTRRLLPQVPGLAAQVTLPWGGRLFEATQLGYRPRRWLVVKHPVTGRDTFFGHLGRPLLFSREMSAARKVDRLARRARRARRGR